MNAGLAGGAKISERLQESLARLREDMARVELWAGALEGFLRPIPDYDAARGYRLTPDEVGEQRTLAPGETADRQQNATQSRS